MNFLKPGLVSKMFWSMVFFFDLVKRFSGQCTGISSTVEEIVESFDNDKKGLKDKIFDDSLFLT